MSMLVVNVYTYMIRKTTVLLSLSHQCRRP